MVNKLKILFTNEASLIKYGISSGFVHLGHEVFIMEGQYRLWDKSKDEQLELFKKALDEYAPHIVFSECFANFAEGIFEHTKEKGVFHAFWSIEDTPYDHWIGDHWSRYADHVFTTTAECLMNYWDKGLKADLLLFGINKDFHKPAILNSKYKNDIALVANNYTRRQESTAKYILPIIKNGYDISIYGNDWWLDGDKISNLLFSPSTYKGMMPYENIPELYSSAKIALGLNCDEQSYTQCSMRMFETLGIGGSLLVSPYSKSQEFIFNDHIYLPKSPQEMLDMIDEILKMSDEQRESKANDAQQFVYKYHNYDLRASKVIDAFYMR